MQDLDATSNKSCAHHPIVGEAKCSERDVALDVFKGFCLALIMLIHIKGSGGAAWVGTWANPFKLAGFFVVSGYLLSLKPVCIGKFSELVGRKFRGIMLPYFTFSIFLLAVLVPYKATTFSMAIRLARVMAAQTVLLRGYLTLWFLPVLFISELFFIGTLFLEKRLHKHWGRYAILVYPLFVVAAICASVFVSPIVNPVIKNKQLVANLILTWLRVLPAFVCICAGYFIYGRLLAACRRHKGICAVASFVFITAGFAIGGMLGGIDWNNNVYGGNLWLFLFSGIASSFGLMLAFNLASRYVHMPILRFIGVNSLVLMATHLPLPIIKLSRDVTAWISGYIPALDCFLSSHFMVKSLWILAIVLLFEIPLIFLFMHTPLKVLIGKKLSVTRGGMNQQLKV